MRKRSRGERSRGEPLRGNVRKGNLREGTLARGTFMRGMFVRERLRGERLRWERSRGNVREGRPSGPPYVIAKQEASKQSSGKKRGQLTFVTFRKWQSQYQRITMQSLSWLW